MKRREFLGGLALLAGSPVLSRAQMIGRAIAIPVVTVFRVPTIAGPAFSGLANGYPLGIGPVSKTGAALVWDWGDGTTPVVNSNPPAHLYADDSAKVVTVSSTDGWSGVTVFGVQTPNGARSPFTGGYLSGNSVLGMNGSTLPPFSFMANLETFYSCDTWFQGAFPHQSMGWAANLKHFDIQGNQFVGLLPSFSGCTQLQYCDIHFSGFQGTLPSFANCTQLQFLRSYSNGFVGPLPSFATCTQLVTFNVEARNANWGTMPSFAACTLLQSFGMTAPGDGTGISGTLPDFSTCTALTDFSMFGSTLLTGYTSGSFATQKNLAALDLSICGLSQAAVNQVLADCVTSLGISGRVACTLLLNGGSNGAPSGAGITNKATLIAAGWTVTTN